MVYRQQGINNAFQPWQFNKVANFGAMKTIQNPNTGSRIQQFQKSSACTTWLRLRH